MAQALALVHLFAVRHVRCAEHGDLVHVESGGRGHAEALAGAGVAAEGPGESTALVASPDTISASGLVIESHQDDHCMALSERRDLRAHDVTPVLRSPQLIGELTYTYQAPLAVVRALYRLAPKISPPALT